MRCTPPTIAGYTCLDRAASAAVAADDTLDQEAAGDAAALACAPTPAEGQCTAADAKIAAAFALPCDDDGTATPDDDSDDCSTIEGSLSASCAVCLFATEEVAAHMDGTTAEDLIAAMAICAPLDKTSGTAGLVVSLALASVCATQL